MEYIVKSEANNEDVIIIGDLNKLVGNGIFGIKNNNEKVSFEGGLIHDLLSTNKLVALPPKTDK